MKTATYSGRGWVLKITRTGTLLRRGEPVEVTEEEAEILDGHPDVTVEDGASTPDTSMARGELDKLAVAAGVDEPGKLPNKEAVIAAIQEAEKA